MSDIAPRSPATGLGHGTARQILEQRRGHAYDPAAVDVGVDGWCDLGEGSGRRCWTWSARMLGRCSGLDRVALVAGQHHERRDGSGYPFGLAGDPGKHPMREP